MHVWFLRWLALLSEDFKRDMRLVCLPECFEVLDWESQIGSPGWASFISCCSRQRGEARRRGEPNAPWSDRRGAGDVASHESRPDDGAGRVATERLGAEGQRQLRLGLNTSVGLLWASLCRAFGSMLYPLGIGYWRPVAISMSVSITTMFDLCGCAPD